MDRRAAPSLFESSRR